MEFERVDIVWENERGKFASGKTCKLTARRLICKIKGNAKFCLGMNIKDRYLVIRWLGYEILVYHTTICRRSDFMKWNII